MGKVDNIKSTLFKENMDKAFSFPLLIYFGLFFNVSLFLSLCPYCPLYYNLLVSVAAEINGFVAGIGARSATRGFQPRSSWSIT